MTLSSPRWGIGYGGVGQLLLAEGVKRAELAVAAPLGGDDGELCDGPRLVSVGVGEQRLHGIDAVPDALGGEHQVVAGDLVRGVIAGGEVHHAAEPRLLAEAQAQHGPAVERVERDLQLGIAVVAGLPVQDDDALVVRAVDQVRAGVDGPALVHERLGRVEDYDALGRARRQVLPHARALQRSQADARLRDGRGQPGRICAAGVPCVAQHRHAPGIAQELPAVVGADQRPVQLVGRLRHHRVERWTRPAVADRADAIACAGVYDVPHDHREARELLERVGELGGLRRVGVPAAVAAVIAPVVRPRAFSQRAVAGVGPAEVGVRRLVGHGGSERQRQGFLLRARLPPAGSAPRALAVTITTRVPRP